MKGSFVFSLDVVTLLIAAITLVLIIVITLLIIQMSKLKKYNKKYEEIWSKFDKENIEEDIKSMLENMDSVKEACRKSEIACEEMDGKILKCVQKVGFVRYDAYDTGNNNLSFILALLNSNNDGVLLNSVYNRNYSNIYAKEVTNGEVDGNLSNEENEALRKAINDKSFM